MLLSPRSQAGCAFQINRRMIERTIIVIKENVKKKHVILTGFMGTGKTEVGINLARIMGRTFIDTDQVVEDMTGLKIPEIFEQHGEPYFRDRESEAVASITNYRSGSLVVATGGGVVLRESNRKILEDVGLIILLTAAPTEIMRRTAQADYRPLLSGPDREQKVQSMLEEREQYYKNCEIRVDTTGLAPLQIVQKIMDYLKSR